MHSNLIVQSFTPTIHLNTLLVELYPIKKMERPVGPRWQYQQEILCLPYLQLLRHQQQAVQT